MTKEKIKRIVQRTIQNHWFYAVCVCVVILFLGFQIYNLHLGALFIQDDCKDMDDTVLLTAIGAKETNRYQMPAQDHKLRESSFDLSIRIPG